VLCSGILPPSILQQAWPYCLSKYAQSWQNPLPDLCRIRAGNPRVAHWVQIRIASVHVSWASRLCPRLLYPLSVEDDDNQTNHIVAGTQTPCATCILGRWEVEKGWPRSDRHAGRFFPNASHPYCTADQLETRRVNKALDCVYLSVNGHALFLFVAFFLQAPTLNLLVYFLCCNVCICAVLYMKKKLDGRRDISRWYIDHNLVAAAENLQ
jgi:hypothetical protein